MRQRGLAALLPYNIFQAVSALLLYSIQLLAGIAAALARQEAFLALIHRRHGGHLGLLIISAGIVLVLAGLEDVLEQNLILVDL